jgi:hypothetical protein
VNKLTAIGMTCALSIPSYAAVLPSVNSKVSAELMSMASEPMSIRSAAASGEPATTSGEEVVIDTAASGDPEALAADLRALGAKHVAVFGRVVSAVLPIAAIPALNGLPSLHLARTAPMITSAGAVTSQGDVAIRSDMARTAFGVDGTGVIVGTLSDSYNCFAALRPHIPSASDGVASGDLPANSLIIREGPCNNPPATPNSPISDHDGGHP